MQQDAEALDNLLLGHHPVMTGMYYSSVCGHRCLKHVRACMLQYVLPTVHPLLQDAQLPGSDLEMTKVHQIEIQGLPYAFGSIEKAMLAKVPSCPNTHEEL